MTPKIKEKETDNYEKMWRLWLPIKNNILKEKYDEEWIF